MTFNKDIHAFQNTIVTIVICITWILYALIVLGLSEKPAQYLVIIQNIFKIYISLFLIIRFNPFRRVIFTPLDATIAFNAGMFLFATTTIDQIAQTYLQPLQDFVDKKVGPNT